MSPPPTNVGAEHLGSMAIPYTLYEKSSTSDLDSFKGCQISSTSTNSTFLFKNFEVTLNMKGLLRLANGARIRPQQSVANPTGYITPTNVIIDDKHYELLADDANKYTYDLRRLYLFFHKAFHVSSHYLSQVGFNAQDGLQIYADMKEHFCGHAMKDINRLIRLIIEYKCDYSKSIQEDIVRLDNIFLDVDYTMGTPINPMMKMAFFMFNFQFDKRPAVEACLANISFVNGTYGQAYQAVLRLVQNIVVGSTDSRHHMKALAPPTPPPSTKNEICRQMSLW